MKKQIRVLLVDDHLMFLEGLKSLLQTEESIQIVAVASSAVKALELLEKEPIDVLISDISMPETDGFELVAQVQKKHPNTNTLMLSMHSEPAIITRIIKQNVNGYLLKNAEKKELLNAIKQIANGENYFSDEVKKIYTESSFNRNKNSAMVVELSRREKEVLTLIVNEYTAKEIADELIISQHTVESHRKNIFSKLGVKNVAGVVKYAYENNMV